MESHGREVATRVFERDRALWDAAERVGGTPGAREAAKGSGKAPSTGIERA